jgi:hypothetical protein
MELDPLTGISDCNVFLKTFALLDTLFSSFNYEAYCFSRVFAEIEGIEYDFYRW